LWSADAEGRGRREGLTASPSGRTQASRSAGRNKRRNYRRVRRSRRPMTPLTGRGPSVLGAYFEQTHSGLKHWPRNRCGCSNRQGQRGLREHGGEVQSWSVPRCPHLLQLGIRSVQIEELKISTCSGAPERSPAGAGDQARGQGLPLTARCARYDEASGGATVLWMTRGSDATTGSVGYRGIEQQRARSAARIT